MRAAEPGRRYSTVAIILHWVVAAALVFQVGLGLRMVSLHGTARFSVFQLHKSVGITILGLAVLRLLWRAYRRPPPLTAHGWERGLAHLVHTLLYVLLFALPLSGWLIVSSSRIAVPTLLYGAIPLPHLPGLAAMDAGGRAAWNSAGEVMHVGMVFALYGLFALHLAGALKHHFVNHDAELARMAPGAKPGKWFDARLVAILLGAVLAALVGLTWSSRATPPAAPAPVAGEAQPAAAPEAAATVTEAPVVNKTDAEANSQAAVEDESGALSSWTIGKGSSLAFHTTWSGDAIDGGFNTFTGDIVFGPDALDKSHVDIRVQTGSVFSGDGQRDETLKSSDWFSTASASVATFKAARFRSTGANRYVASGTLTIKGIALPITLPFTLDITGDKAVMRGTASIDRAAYKIGQGEYAATDEIPAAVRVNVVVLATRKP